MQLGKFSISLNVNNIDASRQFYEKLGFSAVGGKIEEKWLVLKNGSCVIGLFQDMFDHNILTFNPGWDGVGNEVDPFTDVRDLQKQLKSKGITFSKEADEDGSGPDYFTLTDPDGNSILIDQHR